MKTLHKRCAGIDVHKVEVVACLRRVSHKKVEREVRRFPTTTHGLLELADWLETARCTHVAMEATGVYWKPVWHILDGRFALILANAAHVKTVPGRKSDVNDASWLADLLAHGLIRPGFVPPAAIQELRDLTRTRKQLTRESRAAFAANPSGSGRSKRQALFDNHRHFGCQWATHVENDDRWGNRCA
jgi:transposase